MLSRGSDEVMACWRNAFNGSAEFSDYSIQYSKLTNMKNPWIPPKFLRVRSSEVQGFKKNDIELIKTSRRL
jgi:hypothetical protein